MRRPVPLRRWLRERASSLGFMPWVVAVGLVITPTVGLLARELDDGVAADRALAEQADEASRAHLLELGWAPLTGAAARDAAALAARGEVELLSATRQFELPLASGTVSAEPPHAERTPAALGVLARELALYPRGLLRASRFRRVLLCSELREEGRAIPSLPNTERTLLLSVDAPPDFLRRLLHHEVFHFLDYADDDQLQRDPEWSRLNDAAFSYGPGGRFARAANAGEFSHPFAGFVSSYAASALEEDKAELFALAMVAPERARAMAADDVILSQKLARLGAQIERFHPGFGRDFRARLAP